MVLHHPPLIQQGSRLYLLSFHTVVLASFPGYPARLGAGPWERGYVVWVKWPLTEGSKLFLSLGVVISHIGVSLIPRLSPHESWVGPGSKDTLVLHCVKWPLTESTARNRLFPALGVV